MTNTQQTEQSDLTECLVAPQSFRVAIQLPGHDECTDWRRTWNETQAPETLYHVGVSSDGAGLLIFQCHTKSHFTAVSGFIARMHP
jgi:hypothetical protein